MIILKNKKANFNYELLKKYSGGIKLYGFEVKSLKNKRGSFEGAFLTISSAENKKGRPEIFLKNFTIPPYQEKNTPDWYEPERIRKILINKNEITEIMKELKSARLTIIPISIFQNSKNLLKIDFALARGKKKYDKREDIKKRDDLRNIQRNLKNWK